MKYFSTFSGIGGFALGIEQAYELSKLATESKDSTDNKSGASQHGERPLCVGYSEIDKYAVEVYEKHFKHKKKKREIANDLEVVKTIVSNNNYGILEVCYVNIAKKEQSFIKTTGLSVKTALEDTSFFGVKIILKKAGKRGENIILCEDNECSICMGENVFAAEKGKKSSLPLNIRTEMETLTEKDMELAICINSPLKKMINQNTKSYATTVITLKRDIVYAHIKKTKPVPNFGDITEIVASSLPDFDLLVGGFPCQAFSIAGKRAGFDDTRGTLFFDLARIIKEKQPSMVLLENVKGLLSHEGGDTFRTIISTLDELGYDVEWQILNSKDFGVPQNRERVFIIGHLGGFGGRQIFPIGIHDKVPAKEDKGDESEAEHIFSTIATNTKRKESNYIKRLYGLTVDEKIRRLTPTECERLQGFPDGWTEGLSDTQRYKTLGNAVTVNVIKAVWRQVEATV